MLTLKLLIIPIEPSMLLESFSKIVNSTYGYVHTGIQFNNKVVDWDSSGLIVPRSFTKRAYAALDIHSVYTKRQIPITQILTKTVVEFIVEWNKHKEYNSVTCNCQHFVTSLLNAMGIELFWDERLASYLQDIKDNPENVVPHINYIVDKKLVCKKFTSHTDLDNFVNEFKKTIQNSTLNLKIF